MSNYARRKTMGVCNYPCPNLTILEKVSQMSSDTIMYIVFRKLVLKYFPSSSDYMNHNDCESLHDRDPPPSGSWEMHTNHNRAHDSYKMSERTVLMARLERLLLKLRYSYICWIRKDIDMWHSGLKWVALGKPYPMLSTNYTGRSRCCHLSTR